MTDVVVMVPVQRSVLAMLVESSHTFADLQAAMLEHSDVSLTYEEIRSIRAAVELGRKAMEACACPGFP